MAEKAVILKAKEANDIYELIKEMEAIIITSGKKMPPWYAKFKESGILEDLKR